MNNVGGSIKPRVTPPELHPSSYALFELRPFNDVIFSKMPQGITRKKISVNFIELRPWGLTRWKYEN